MKKEYEKISIEIIQPNFNDVLSTSPATDEQRLYEEDFF